MAKVKLFPIMADARKYDLALLTAADEVSPGPMVRSFNIPDVSSDWMSSNGRAVVLLKQIAGIVQAGNLKARFSIQPKAIEESV